MKKIVLFLCMFVVLFGNEFYDQAKKAEKQKDYVNAEKFYRKSCDIGNDQACLDLTNLYFNGKGNGNMIVAAKLAKMLCNKNNAEGCFFLGYMYSEGKGVNKNIEFAKKSLEKSCSLGEDKACINAANIYVKEKNYDLAIKNLEKSYHYGNYVAGSTLGSFYASGTGVKQDIEKARNYHQDTCDNGNISTSCAFLGVYYIKMKKYQRAEYYTKKTCEMSPDKFIKESKQFIAESCANLGLLYAKGLGVELSMYKAKKYFKKACDMDLDTACKYYNMTFQR